MNRPWRDSSTLSVLIVVAALLDHRWLVEIELEAIVSSH